MSDIEARVRALDAGARDRLTRRLDDLVAAGAPDARGVRAQEARSGARLLLVAYIEPTDEASASAQELRAGLEKTLPDYMVPAKFLFLDELPLTTSGKVDKRALPDIDAAAPVSDAAPRPLSETEVTLAGIWAEVLGFDAVDGDDDFFEMGGDSLLSIRILARAKAAGIVVTPKQFFENPTVRAMAAVANAASTASPVAKDDSGSIPLTPIQQWFFELDFPDPHYWNQAVLLAVPSRLKPETYARALGELTNRHDALRLAFERKSDSEGSGWVGSVRPKGKQPEWVVEDISSFGESEQAEAMEETATRLHASIELGSGALLKGALFIDGGKTHRLLVVIHHLAVDQVSWSILLEQLYAICDQIERGGSVSVRPATTFREWALRLDAHARSAEVVEEREHWLTFPPAIDVRIPLDHSSGRDENLVKELRIFDVTLDRNQTERLLVDVPRETRTQANEVVLTALARTLVRWSGRDQLAIDLEGHGREEIAPGLDVSSTVGWFTTVFPAYFELARTASLVEALESVKEQLRAIPRAGLGHGLIRYLGDDEDAKERLKSAPRPEVLFNYLGVRRDHGGSFPVAEGPTGVVRSDRGRRPYLIEVNAWVNDGLFVARWIYGSGAHESETIQRLAAELIDELGGLIAHCLAGGDVRSTPSDFPLARVDQSELDRIAKLLDDAD